ncbi:MAG TPA: 1-(5-phosphoribosyl)-5-[(5-phosphoribosylamino)methylideneamino]imidazole-4-carboxamide isomerase [Armatimonadota bacterium]|nr:1-(5-phosphoribosyl)-5-[(5-phosphoribosylamino)methylideneamino]imidazole-4-carboxamide isomerase [Armatimonadota bacterium]HQK94594.1 1-(5-phosphoribosyl)-5-[(5-phosphoribosylamino)methylideneamino]imidazole-4-carboxamide isomerase [Armatimonadota bacterium]
MIVIPSIDIRGGQVVRLRYGDPDQQTVYERDPAATARYFEECGAELIHVVDLDGAFGGEPRARDIIRAIAAAVSVPIEVGGGIRSMAVIEGHLSLGVKRVVIGTAGIEDPAFLVEAVERFGPETVIGGLDARDGRVALRGWVDTSSLTAGEVGRRMHDAGVRTVVHTDIGRDGVMTGPNVDASLALAATTGLRVIVSGGVSSLADIRRVCEAARMPTGAPPALVGCITGRAIYEGAVDLAAAVELSRAC